MNPTQAHKQQAGFSLLELMIAVLILAIGLLGMAAMQSVALSSNQEAQLRVQALAIAEDLASRMRANRDYVNISQEKYPLIPANHATFNVYSDADYNATAGAPVAPSAILQCGDPETATDLASLQATLNCRANSDISDIRRQVNPLTSGRLLPAGSLLYVDCADKTNFDYTGTEDTDPCSPGSVHTIYVIWPTSAGNVEAGQLDNAGNNRNLLNARCAARLATAVADGDTTLLARDAGCVVMDIVP